MKKLLLSILLLVIPMLASAYDIAVENADGVTIFYNYYNGGEELEIEFANRNAVEVNIPEDVTYMSRTRKVTRIGNMAFDGCADLISVTIPTTVTSIGNGAFFGCIGLTSITIPNSVTSIGDETFYSCRGLTSVTIPNSVTSIGESAFGGCIGLTSVTIPNSVTNIDNYAFGGCSSLTSVTINSNSIMSYNYVDYGDYVGLGRIFGSQVVSYVIGDDVTSIGNRAFSSCTSLSSVTIPNSVISIGNEAFQSCKGLTSISIPNSVTSLGESAFSGCIGLTSVVIPNSVTSIGDYSFSYCSGLTSVTIGNSVKSIGEGAFYGCDGLTSVVIGNSVTSIGDYSFSHCSGLTSVTIGNSVTTIGNYAFDDCVNLSSVTIGNSVKSIEGYAFYGCTGLTSVHINDISAWLNIEFRRHGEDFNGSYSNPLYYAQHLYVNDKEITNLVIPEGVTNIGGYAFCGYENLTSVTIPSSVTSIGKGAFSICTGLTSLNINSNTIISKVYTNGWDDFGLVLHAFYGCSALTSLTIGNSVTSIGEDAFADCTSLTSVTIPNSVTSIGGYAFAGCSGLTSVTIPNSVTYIGDKAFAGCSSLTSVSIGNSVTYIGDVAFEGCTDLSSVHISDLTAWLNIEFFELRGYNGVFSNPLYYAQHFYINDKEITNLVIPEGVTNICNYAFYGFKNLISVTIPQSVTTIGREAFYGCSGLTSVISKKENPCNINSDCFSDDVYNNSTLYVPKGAVDNYKSTNYWNKFVHIEDGTPLDFDLTYIIDGETYRAYILKEGESITPEAVPTKEGYTFSGWSEIPSTMPANDVTITGSFTINKYILMYTVDGVEYNSTEVDYGEAIIPEETPTKEGYTFSGWSEIPSTMPASDVIIIGTFIVNKYTITYIVDGSKLITEEVAYGSTITPPSSQRVGCDIQWNSHPTTMPAYDITIYGSYTTGINAAGVSKSQDAPVYNLNGQRVYTSNKGVYIKNGRKVIMK